MDWKHIIRVVCREIDINPRVSLFVVLGGFFFVLVPVFYVTIKLLLGQWYLVIPFWIVVALAYLLISWIIYKAHDV